MSWRLGGSGDGGERAGVFWDRINRISGLTGWGRGVVLEVDGSGSLEGVFFGWKFFWKSGVGCRLGGFRHDN